MFKFTDSFEFLAQFKDGQRSALEAVYFAYVDEVESIVRRFLSFLPRTGTHWHQVDTGDLVQDVFARAFGDKARSSFDGERDYGPFLGTLTRNLLVDWARKRGREVPSDELDQVPAPSSRGRPADWADRETMEAVNQYIDELPDDLRQVHQHRYVDCRSQQEVCSALGISRQTLRTREEHLRSGLRRRLKRLELSRGPETHAGSTVGGGR
jgi:RNA polymerase sigma factor (sigma-70 family)